MSTQTGANLTKVLDDLLVMVNKFIEESDRNKATFEESEKQCLSFFLRVFLSLL